MTDRSWLEMLPPWYRALHEAGQGVDAKTDKDGESSKQGDGEADEPDA